MEEPKVLQTKYDMSTDFAKECITVDSGWWNIRGIQEI